MLGCVVRKVDLLLRAKGLRPGQLRHLQLGGDACETPIAVLADWNRKARHFEKLAR
jgi:hypothetical protein